MIGWNEIFETEVIKKTVLLTNRLTHHHRDSPLTPSAPRNHASPSLSNNFFNKLSQKRTLASPTEVEHWSLTTLREKLVKIGAKVVRHGRYVMFQLAEVAVPRELFRKILSLIDDLRPRPAPA